MPSYDAMISVCFKNSRQAYLDFWSASVHTPYSAQQQQQQHSLFSQASWGRLEMKPERVSVHTPYLCILLIVLKAPKLFLAQASG